VLDSVYCFHFIIDIRETRKILPILSHAQLDFTCSKKPLLNLSNHWLYELPCMKSFTQKSQMLEFHLELSNFMIPIITRVKLQINQIFKCTLSIADKLEWYQRWQQRSGELDSSDNAEKCFNMALFTSIFSSPNHEVVKVKYSDGTMSNVRCRVSVSSIFG
jgi:hypothetical protein